uniref:sn-1-specific diacylglycerol lipase n=1 Tax=Ornithodoros turicata TaxID=34597 RepID=A0A2R5LN43_9ACAR
MPGVIACGRRWNFSSDDIPVPTLVDICIRTIVLLTVGAACLYYANQWECLELSLFFTTYLGMLGIATAGLLVDIPLGIVASRGTMFNARPRRHALCLLYFKLAVYLSEITYQVYATYVAFNYTDVCMPPGLQSFYKWVLLVPWIALLLFLLYLFHVYDPLGHPKHRQINDTLNATGEIRKVFLALSEKSLTKIRKSWKRRLKFLHCCAVGHDKNNDDAYEHAVDVFSAQFQDVDVVPSDLAVAFVLLRKKQKRRLAFTGTSSANPCGPRPIPFTTDGGGTSDRVLPENALHFLRFAWGSYGWPVYVLSHPCTWMCTLWNGIRCTNQEDSDRIVGDNCFQCNAATLRCVTQIAPEDSVYSSFSNGVYRLPFFVAFDHKTCSVVVAVRGTASLDDLVTDTAMTHGVLSDIDGVPAGKCNLGVLRCAQHLLPLLEAPLAAAFREHPNYRLVLTGHSLGGSVTAVLSLMLRSKYPTLQCYAYSPTTIFDATLARLSKECVLTVAVGDDVIMRTGLAQLFELKRECIQVVIEADVPKSKLMYQFCAAVCCGARITPKYNEDGRNDDVGETALEEKVPKDHLAVGNSCDNVRQLVNAAMASGPQFDVLYPPGRILLLTKCSTGFSMSWAPAEYFDHIVISPSMFSDHRPDVIMRALRSVTTKHL